MRQPTYAVLFRTHIWDAFGQRMFKHLGDRTGSGDIFVLADETHGTLDTFPYEKISHTIDFSSFGLDVDFPHKEKYLWYNGDFPLYKSLVDLPSYDYYCMVEYDALVNCSLDQLIQDLHSAQIEVVGYRLQSAPDSIAQRLRGYFQNTNSLLPCVFIVSRRAAEYLYQTRRRIRWIYRENTHLGWPFCEGFLGAAISERPDLRYADIRAFGDVSKYEWWPPHLYGPELLTSHPSFVHPVLDPPRFARSRVQNGAADFFLPDSPIRRDLEQLTPEAFIPALFDIFADRQEAENLDRLRQYLRMHNLERLDRMC